MRTFVIVLFISLAFFSCKKSTVVEEKEAPVMYDPSEMAILMRQMYEANKLAKSQIEQKQDVLELPIDFLNIHTAVLTDPSERDAEFDSIAVKFVEFQKQTFGAYNENSKVNFNKGINACVACHETRCVGPLPKIKKLLIH